MKRNWLRVALAGALLAVGPLLILHLYYGGVQEVLSQFRDLQISYANHFSKQIQFFIEGHCRELRDLSSFPSIQRGRLRQLGSDLETYARQIDRTYVKGISLYDDSGKRVCATGETANDSMPGGYRFFPWAKREENREKILLLPAAADRQSLTFILATPLYRDLPDSKDLRGGVFTGVLTFTLDMKKFLVSQLDASNPKMNLNQIWIMDRDGTLLFGPDHPEMVMRNIFKREASCQSCHFSFRYAEEILTKREGTFDYRTKTHPKKIAAFASMEFENVSWVVVVNASYDRVTGFLGKSLREHLILFGIIVFAFSIGSALVIRKERTKVRAEEELVRWQEKMAERSKAERALELERNKLKGVLDSMSDGVYIVSPEYEIQYVNPVLEKAYGPLKGRRCYEYLHDLSGACSWCKAREVFAGNTIRWEWRSLRNGKTYDLLDTPIRGPEGAVHKLQFIRDVSDWKRAEKALRNSEKRYRQLVETMNEGLAVQDEHDRWIYVNHRFSEMLGYPREEIIGRPVSEFLSETDRAVYREQVEADGVSWLRKDGQTILTRVSPKTILDERGQFRGSFAVISDITERRRAEEALKKSEGQLRALSSQLLSAQETERKRISRELHDELGQSLTVMKLRLNFIEKNLMIDQTELLKECRSGIQYIDQLIENIRRLSRDLSPTILEDFGLSAAIRWLIHNFAKNYATKVTLSMMDIDSLLSRDTHVVIYRVIQEALTNIGKHSQARNVSVVIRKDSTSVLFSIQDDGIGFENGERVARSPEKRGLGLATMKGRVQMVGGDLTVWSEETKGTRITLRIPMERGESV